MRRPLLGQGNAALRQGGELTLPPLALGDPFPAQRPAVGGGGQRPDLGGQAADGRAFRGNLLLEPGHLVVDQGDPGPQVLLLLRGVAGTPSSPTQPSGSVHDRRGVPVRS